MRCILGLSKAGMGDGDMRYRSFDHHRVVVAGGDVAVAGDVLVQFDVHEAVFGEAVHAFGFGAAAFEAGHRFGLRDLVDEDLALRGGGVRGCGGGFE